MKNYLFDLYPGFPNGFTLDSRKDPDSKNKNLYNDFNRFFFNDGDGMFPNGNSYKVTGIIHRHDKNDKTKIWLEIKLRVLRNGTAISDIGLSTDYIGPSVNWAQTSLMNPKCVDGISNVNLPDEVIVSYLKISRTLGGHIVFPMWIRDGDCYPSNVSINKARGGKDAYFDRFDLTLFSIKQWYSGSYTTILSDTLEKNRIWLEQFNSFPEFIKFFKLHSFVDSDYRVYDLTSYNNENETEPYKTLKDDNPWIPNTDSGYELYIAGVNRAISLRNKELGL